MQSAPLLTLSVTTASAVLPCRGVTFANAQAAAGARILGVAVHEAPSGRPLAVVALGTAIGEAGAAFLRGEDLATDAQGRFVKHASGPVAAVALQDAAVGDLAEILIR